MVSLVNKFAAKIEEKKGALSEDEVSPNCTSVGKCLGLLASAHRNMERYTV